MHRKNMLYFVVLLVELSCYASAETTSRNLPKIYEMDDITMCKRKHGSYCKFDLKLIAKNETDPIWLEIEATTKNNYSYDHSVIHRILCVPSQIASENSEYVEKLMERKLSDVNLAAKVTHATCMVNSELDSYDYFFVPCFFIYMFIVSCATIYDIKKEKWFSSKKVNPKVDQYITAFSITSNWNKIVSGKRNDDFNRLKSMQGIRFYSMIIVVTFHTNLVFAQSYLENTEWMESMHYLYFKFVLDFYVVQTFFVFSSWLLANQILDIEKRNGSFTLRDCFVLAINRLFRFMPTLLMMDGILASAFTNILNAPMTFEMWIMNRNACRNNWWANVLQVNNLFNAYQMCNAATWYLSIDSQFYLLGMILMYVMLKWKLGYKKTLAFFIMFSVAVYGYVIYTNDFFAIYRLYPENMKRQNFYHSKAIQALYFSFYSSWTSSFVGLFLGIYYFNTKKLTVQPNAIDSLWPGVFCSLPIFAIMIAMYAHEGVNAAIYGPLMKPLFALGVGFGVLGMSRTVKSTLKSICECEFAVFMANFSFSAYIFHILVVFGRGTQTHKLMTVDSTELIQAMVVDVIASFTLGIIGTVIVEQPGANLQRFILPQIKKHVT